MQSQKPGTFAPLTLRSGNNDSSREMRPQIYTKVTGTVEAVKR